MRNGVKNEIFVTNQTYIWTNLWLKLNMNKRSYAVGVIYKPHEQNTTIFLDEFDDIVLTVTEIICMRNFNSDLETKRDSIIGSNFLIITDSIVNSRFTDRSGSLVDYIIEREDAVVKEGIMLNDFSDHAIVSSKLNFNKFGNEDIFLRN